MIASIPVDRARARYTVSYALHDRVLVGVELNPLDSDYGPLLNVRLVDETERRPALIVGTSSDRIGTPSGRAVYATLSKDVEGWLGLPLAPYAGLSFGGFDHEWRGIGGVQARWGEDWASSHLWDGENLHHVLDRSLGGGFRVGLVVVEQEGRYYFGLRLGATSAPARQTGSTP